MSIKYYEIMIESPFDTLGIESVQGYLGNERPSGGIFIYA